LQSACRLAPPVHMWITCRQGKDGPDSVAIGNPERHVRKASHCGNKQQ